MAAYRNTMEQHTNCCSTFAAAYTSARIRGILDTAVLAVSILVLCLGRVVLNF